ncbi:PhzF family phenazine biosynthesis protein [Jannaschia seohaensis]|uniref:Trans-2,3-dihydro-3-hydroxyanthranilate isomerase n=1 Tax=Jannaschia seohaensis TaxID=475081 RepID=A0A2Y9C7T6_9RHOB|nr:PhzF family phenazine biosynthesis protein [Jannaschia seohaensis]PWJ18198.1 trans-2,3-dihydro-3-hydroxyanthranilate isomerase [Jannaschia seohaensis]SSA46723.1 trans-2,3-dihydro-3-hydroxyanthranilate isomerase [Jannaschia seohaensis]
MLPFEVWDVFTDTPFTGNPLAIVETPGDLTTGQMQTIARQFNLSETIFLMPPRDPAHTARARIFFPTAEIPFAGHPTVGAALFLAGRAGLETVYLEEEAGLVPVEIAAGRAQFTAPVLPAPHGGPFDAALCASALGLPEAAIGPHRPGAFAGGPAFAYVPVRDRAALAQARPSEPGWTALMEAAQVDSAWLYDPDLNARMFSPGAGIPEDPATGSASAILAAQLLANGALADGRTECAIVQGEDMGRRSEIGFEADVAGGAITAVRISGRAVPVSEGRIRIPE